MKQLFILSAVLVLIFGNLFAEKPDSLFFKANLAYDNGYFQEAADNYLLIKDSGYESADLYFNMGNAYYKLNNFPSAILYYEKAKKLDPNNEDITFNLGVANAKIVDKIEPVPELFFKTWWRSFYNMFSANTWAIISVVSFMVFFILLAFYLLSRITPIRKLAFYSGLFVLFITLFTFSLSYQKYHTFHHENYAIVFTPTITVKSSPNPNSVDLFVIHEGAKVQIKDNVGSWVEIRIANGSVGWLPSESLQKI